MTRIIAIFLVIFIVSCNSGKKLIGESWTIQIPSSWQVSKRNTGYQISSSELPGIIQVSSHPYFKTEAKLQEHVNTWPDEFIQKQGAKKGKDRYFNWGDIKGRYIEYEGESKSFWLSWWLQKGEMFVAATYISEYPIPENDKNMIENIIQTISIEETTNKAASPDPEPQSGSVR